MQILLAPSILGAGFWWWEIVARNWALFSILLTLLLLIVVPAAVLAKYLRICLNIIRDTEPPLSAPMWGYPIPPGEEKDFYASDGIRLRGMFFYPPGREARELSGETPKPPRAPVEDRGTIIFAPEFKSDLTSCARYCRPLLEAGYTVFSFDFRGNGKSMPEEGYTPRQWTSDREVADMAGAIAFVEQWLEARDPPGRETRPTRPVEIGLFGISRGGCAAILASENCDTVKAIVTDGAFSSDCTLEHLMRRWAKIFARVRIIYENHPPEFWRFLRWSLFLTCRVKFKCRFPSVRKALARMGPRPLLLIHGKRDSYIPVEQSRLLYAMAPQPKYLWIVSEAKHNQSVDVRPEEYARRTVDFFDRYLARRADAQNIYNEGRFIEMALGRGASAGEQEIAEPGDVVAAALSG